MTGAGIAVCALAFADPVASQTDAFGAPFACVVCSEPPGLYRCRLEDGTDGGAIKAADRAVHFVCITELARIGGHASCRVRRDLVGGCDAPERLVSLKGYAGEGSPPAALPDPVSPGGPQAAEKAPPQTLEELARQTAATSKDGLRKAGEAMTDTARDAGSALKTTGEVVGDALETTWTCMTSLFQRCGRSTAAREPEVPTEPAERR